MRWPQDKDNALSFVLKAMGKAAHTKQSQWVVLIYGKPDVRCEAGLPDDADKLAKCFPGGRVDIYDDRLADVLGVPK